MQTAGDNRFIKIIGLKGNDMETSGLLYSAMFRTNHKNTFPIYKSSVFLPYYQSDSSEKWRKSDFPIKFELSVYFEVDIPSVNSSTYPYRLEIEVKSLLLQKHIVITAMDWKEEAVKYLHRSLHPVKTELNELDWKSGLSEKSERLAQHISAFANQTGGGTFAFGINNDASLFTPSREQAEEIVKKIGNIARNNLNIPIRIEHTSVEMDGSGILLVHIPEQKDKPVYLRGMTIYDSYYRSAGQTHKISKSQVHAMLAAAEGQTFEDRIALSRLPAEKVITLLDFAQFYKLIHKSVPSGIDHIIEGMEAYGFCRKEDGAWAVTNLGAVLLARDLKDFPSIAFKNVVVRQYKGDNNLHLSSETFFHEGYAISLDKIVAHIMSLLEKTELIRTPFRENKYPYPEVSIRELLANALIHQDFDMQGTILSVEIFGNRLAITNPGVPLIDTNRFIDMPPKSRNEKVAQSMFLFNLCEKRGSGMDRAVAGVEEMRLPAIKIEKGEYFTRVTIYEERNYLDMSKTEKIQACYQHACLLFEEEIKMTNQSLRERLSIGRNNSAVASRIINDTIAAGLIKLADENSGSRRYSAYVPFYA